MKPQESGIPSTLAPLDYWHIAIRRRWVILGGLALCLGIAAVLCVLLPKSYRSSTLILVEEQKIPEDYVKAIVGVNVEERLVMIKQQVMSRTLLSAVIEEFKLYGDEVRDNGVERVIEDLRKNVKVDTVTAGARGTSVEAFTISFAHENPRTARDVTAKLASKFIEENLKMREQFVEGASEFLDHELTNAKATLETKEQAISEFKAKHMGELPEQTEANLRALDRIQEELAHVSESIHSQSGRLAEVEKGIGEYQSTGKTTTGLVTGAAGPDPLVLRLKELERNLATLRAEYKENYPDIIVNKQEIESIKAELSEKYGKEKGEAAAKPEGEKIFDPYLHELSKQRSELKTEISSLKERQRQLVQQRRELEQRVERAPAVEQQLLSLVRDYENMQNNYKSLLDKRLSARVAENLEKRQKGEQFRIIDPANVPENPEAPNKLRIMLIGLAAGCAFGFGGAVGLEQLNPAFRRPEDAESALGLPVLAAIPDFRLAYTEASEEALSDQFPSGRSNVLADPGPGGQEKGAASRWARFLRGTGAGGAENSRHWFERTKVEQQWRDGRNLIARWRRQSVITEQLRVAAARLVSLCADRGHAVIVVTSAVKGEGKSCTAVNLGYVLAENLGKRTLVIDADLKNPTVHRYAGVAPEPGLVNLLTDEGPAMPMDIYLHRVGETTMWVMPGGRAVGSVIELFKLHEIPKSLANLKDRFDYIVIDAPPVLPLADMEILARIADVLTVVVRAGVTPRDVVAKSLRRLEGAGTIALILTGVEALNVPYYVRAYYHDHASS